MSMEAVKMIQPESIGHFMEGKTIVEAYFSNGGGILPTAAGKGPQYYDPNQPPDRLVMRLRDGAGVITEIQIMNGEIVTDYYDYAPTLEAYYEDRPEYFDRQ